ncbi:Lhr family helicase, partial [Corynebacterium heidelbergense]
DPGAGARGEGGVEKESALPQQRSVWPHVQRAIYDQVMENRATLVFVNSRRAAERLTGALNELWAREHDPESLAASTRRDPAQLMARSERVTGSEAVIARAHHGSVSKDERADIEADLKSGVLRCVVATSSLELGIDMGLVDRVIQVGAPPSVAAAVQRCGRAGHSVGATSRATIYPLHKQDAESSVVVVDRMLRGELEPLHVVTNALDILAQQTVASAVQADVTAGLIGSGEDRDTNQQGSAEPSGAQTIPDGALSVEAWWGAVRRAYPFAALPREAFDATLELISGHYPSTDFADLKPRAVYDATAGTLVARPGTQRVAVTSGGTIPDRGMFGVFLAAGEEAGARRVGELDEEMVYESRVGDIFTLGASSWRILEINRDQVIVAPAAGHTGRLPFWTGDAEGRPVELGRAIGENRRSWGSGAPGDIRNRDFVDANTRANLDAFYANQKESAGIIPDERTILIERFRDEIGDWRVVVHSPLGRGVNAPWAMALGAQLQRDTGIDAMAVAGDDGMVLRLPYSEEPPGADLLLGRGGVGGDSSVAQISPTGHAGHIGSAGHTGHSGSAGVANGTEDGSDDTQAVLPQLDLGMGAGEDPADGVLADVMDNVGSSALFAGRFRECAARSLLLPRRNPGKRQPLWQQRQRAAQLLDVARPHPEFPVMVETMRECLHDVYDLDSLGELIRQLGQRGAIRVAEVTTEGPGAFAESLLFTYTSAFMYEGDSAERAAALAVDPALLAAVLGKSGGNLLLDPKIVRQVVETVQWLAEGRKAGTLEQVVDMLRSLGPLTQEAIAQRFEPRGVAAEDVPELLDRGLKELIPHRLAQVSFGGRTKIAVVEDVPLLRDGLGVPVPPGVAADPTTIPDAIDQLLLRWMRHQGPIVARTAAEEFGLGVATAESILRRWVQERRLEAGTYLPGGTTQILGEAPAAAPTGEGGSDEGEAQYVDTSLLRRLRSATLAAARGALEPVSRSTYARFLQAWHGIGESDRADLMGIIEQLAGIYLPASAWETLVLPARIPDYRPGDLDELLNTGEVIAVGGGSAGSNDALVTLLPAIIAPALLAGVHPDAQDQTLGTVAAKVLDHVRAGGAFLAAEIAAAVNAAHTEIDSAMWELFDAGLLSPDSFAPLRARLVSAGNTGKSAHRAPRRDRGRGSTRKLRMGRSSFTQTARSEEARARRAAMSAYSNVPGRWSAVPQPQGISDADRAVALGEAWLDRYGVVTRGSIVAEKSDGGFAQAYRTLSAWEDSGAVLRGYIIDGLGGAQFASRPVINQLRRMDALVPDENAAPEPTQNAASEPRPILLAATDPANPFGAALPWPSPNAEGNPAPLQPASSPTPTSTST